MPFTEKADVYVINTCSVTNIADRKSRQMIHRARKRNPDAVIVATGCYVQAQAGNPYASKVGAVDAGGHYEQAQSRNSYASKADVADAVGCYRQELSGHSGIGRFEADKNGVDQPQEYLGADIIIGNNRKHELLTILDEFFQMNSGEAIKDGCEKSLPCVKASAGLEADAGQDCKEHPGGNFLVHVIDINDRSQPYEELSVAAPAEHTRAFVKVQDGCNQFCSYCIIPYVRGRVRSRGMESVMTEVHGLAAKGYREVVLTGIHLSSYGVDLRAESQKDAESQGDARPQEDGGLCPALHSAMVYHENGLKVEENALQQDAGLLALIRAVCAVDGMERVRLGSLEPKIVTEDFARELAAMPKVCPHFHLSLQSGCDETLRRMNRRYTTAEYEEGCRLLRKYFDDPAITTDVIVGFPGETEEEFAATKEFLERIHFYEMHVFKYSRRKGTRADRMPDQVPEQVRSVRSEELIALGERMSQEYRQRHIGKQTEVLLEEAMDIAGEKYFVGYTPEYIKVAVPFETEADAATSGRGDGDGADAATSGRSDGDGADVFASGRSDGDGAMPQNLPVADTMNPGCIVSGRIKEKLQGEIYLTE